MNRAAADLLPPRVAIIDDESQIHASIRLRLGKDYDLVSFHDARRALEAVAKEKFDLCLVDIHMPHMDGLKFIEQAKERDPALGYVVLSAFASDDNLRRTIPLQVYDFISKPFPDKKAFEARLPEWISRTRQRRRDDSLAQQAGTIDSELNSAHLEREVELVAAESARDALLQIANLLTTIHAHLIAATSLAAARARLDPGLMHLARNLELGRRTAEAAVSVAEGFFDSAYANRDSSSALVHAGLHHAISIASRMCRAEETSKAIDFSATDEFLPVQGLAGIEFLLMLAPAIGFALNIAPENSAVRINTEPVARLENASKDVRFRNFLWVNRRHALNHQAGALIVISVNAAAMSRPQAENWLKGEAGAHAAVTARGLVQGLQKCRGLLGLAVAPPGRQFQLVLALPT